MSYTDAKYIAKNTPLFKGETPNRGGNTNPNAILNRKLFWVTRNAILARKYGPVALYKPVRKLKLLKLTYRTVAKILRDPAMNPELKKLLLLSWGGQNPNNAWLNQYKALMIHDPTIFETFWNKKGDYLEVNNNNFTHIMPMNQLGHTLGFRNNKGEPIRAGRYSKGNLDSATYKKLKEVFQGRYDGLWSPMVRSPYHLKFPSEIVIFNARQVLQRFPASNALLNQYHEIKAMRQISNSMKMIGRSLKKNSNTRVNNIGNFFGNK